MMQEISTKGWTRADYIRFYSSVWKAPVIPIDKKKQATVKWTEFQNRLPTQQELDKWFKEGTPWGLAVVCGAVAGNLFSLDIDTDELFRELKAAGAFPKNSAIFKSARGYHVFMRAAGTIPYSLKEHNPALGIMFWELGISGDRSLSIVPDTPDRHWIDLYDEVATVDYEVWLRRYIGYTRDIAKTKDDLYMLCPYHQDNRPSCGVSMSKRCFHCLGCGAKGTIQELLDHCRDIGHPVPKEILERLLEDTELLTVSTMAEGEDITVVGLVDQLLEAGENAKAIISGVAGIGKTTLGLSLGIRVAQGKKVLEDYEVLQALRVGYVNFEQRGSSVRRQAKQMEAFAGPTENLLFIDGMGLKITNKKDREALRATILHHGIKLLICDSIISFVTKYNDEDEAIMVREFLAELVDKHDIAVLVIHHTTTSGEQTGPSSAKGAIGKTLVEWCATKLSYHELSPKRENIGQLEGTTRGWGDFDQLILYEDISNMATAITPEQAGLSKDEKKMLAKPLVVRQLQRAILFCRRCGMSMEQIAEEMGVTRQQVYDWLDCRKFPDEQSTGRIYAWVQQIRQRGRTAEPHPGHNRVTTGYKTSKITRSP